MRLCIICKEREAIYAYQPFGPGEAASFAFLGSHYRGYPVLPVCDDCKRHMQEGFEETFAYKGQRYQVNGRRLPVESAVRFVWAQADDQVHVLVGDPTELALCLCGQPPDGAVGLRHDPRPIVKQLCTACMRAYVDARQWDEEDREKLKPYPIERSAKAVGGVR